MSESEAFLESGPRQRSVPGRGEDGGAHRDWTERLPGLVEELRVLWCLDGLREPAGTDVYVAATVVRPGLRPAVLTIAPPWARPADALAALRVWDGAGAPAVLRADVERGAILLERIVPGRRAGSGEATEVARLLDALHVEPPRGLPLLREVVGRRLGAAVAEGRVSAAKAAWADAALERLDESPAPPVLLHGALDDRALILCERRGLVAVGPLPCVGDPAYDAGTWVHARRRPGRRARLETIVAATGMPRDRVRDWAAIAAVHG